MADLADFNTPERLKELVERLTDGGKCANRFENMTIHNICKWTLAGCAPMKSLRIYGFPAVNPLYIFIIEQNDLQFPQLHVRTPSEGHDSEILVAGIKAIISHLLPILEKQEELLLDADMVVRDTFFNLVKSGELPFEITDFDDLYPFYIDEEQKKTLAQIEVAVPEGFKIDVVNVEKEYKQIHEALTFASKASEEMTRERLADLPSVCIRDADGDLASWQMSKHFGQLTHLYAVPKHRGKGIGSIAEILLAQKFARDGLEIFKYVDYDNEFVFKGTMKNPLWSQWKREGEQDAILWSFSLYKLVK